MMETDDIQHGMNVSSERQYFHDMFPGCKIIIVVLYDLFVWIGLCITAKILSMQMIKRNLLKLTLYLISRRK